MKVISLNTWCGRAGSSIYDFFYQYKYVDIFCLQEVDLDGTKFGLDITGSNPPAGDPYLFRSVQDILVNHHGFFSPTLGRWWGNAIFVKKEIYRNITASGELIISDAQQQYVDYDTWFRRTIQWVDFSDDRKEYTLINLHGLWEKGKGKDDSSDRIDQSKKLIEFMDTKINRKIILTGDFNLNPDTKSIKMIDDYPLKNLIKEYNITDTRTSYYKKESRFADYTFVSRELEVKEFYVLPEEVSDHAPLFLEI
ncbi:MAG: endonuclease/exonuclease/phosphatase family metal-dependent hydrolase [Candidatus Paceibacteria bacterium]|jgi:endonuclease/exonuclease/phosphatase family metal-dependent hydrolase